MRRSLTGLVLLFASLLAPAVAAQEGARRPPDVATHDSRLATVFYLVRHAEKLDDSRDPPLNEAGRARGAALALVLRDAGVTRIWSTNLLRTRQTAAPLAERLGVAVELYDPLRLDDFAAELRRTPGRHLVVGHSNTTPDMVRALGGGPGEPMQDDEYDRLYVVVIAEDVVTTSLLRFGRSP